MSLCVVFDIGGTSMRTGLYIARADRVDAIEIRPTPNHLAHPDSDGEALQQRVLEEITALVRARIGRQTPARIGLALPGPIDAAGNPGHMPTLLGTRRHPGFAFKARLEARFPGARVTLLNDVSAAGYGLVDRDHQEFCLLTISSGVGHKVFVAGQPIVGPNGAGGEIGHWRVDARPDAPACECGRIGHLAALASGRAILGQVQRAAAEDATGFDQSHLYQLAHCRPERIENTAIAAAFHLGDPWVTRAIEPAVRFLGQAVAAIHLIIGTERFVIMGGFGQALGPRFCQILGSAAAQFSWGPADDWNQRIHLVPADRPIALLGAGRYACRDL